MELNAVRHSLETSLYRKEMLQLITSIKAHTSENKIYKDLLIYLESPQTKIDVAVQTDDAWDITYSNSKIHNSNDVNRKDLPIKMDLSLEKEPQNSTLQSEITAVLSPRLDPFSSIDGRNIKFDPGPENENSRNSIEAIKLKDDQSIHVDSVKNDNSVLMEDEYSQDSLLQHMEDMFCESDDSSDLTTLIEKYSGITKAKLDNEINNMCLETDDFITKNTDNFPQSNNMIQSNANKNTLSNRHNKLSINSYKRLRELKTKKLSNEFKPIVKQMRKDNEIWFIEKVHQVSKLKQIMNKVSLTNYRKHGKLTKRFSELFGESDDEDMMPVSPICIEEHLTACKERIAPWVVKYLMPFYKKRRIKSRQLFKTVAKHLTDMLIIQNTFPEQDCVNKYIQEYFKNKRNIATKQDIF
ncbi:uncharacterized protein [Prorops nasuta]